MGYVSTGMGDRFGALLVSLMALRLTLIDQNPFWSCCNWCSLILSMSDCESGRGSHKYYISSPLHLIYVLYVNGNMK